MNLMKSYEGALATAVAPFVRLTAWAFLRS